MIIGRSSGLWKTGGTPLSLTFVREGQFVADGNGLMGTQVPKPSRGTVRFWDLRASRKRAIKSAGRVITAVAGRLIGRAAPLPQLPSGRRR